MCTFSYNIFSFDNNDVDGIQEGAQAIGHIYYNNDIGEDADGIRVSARMKSDKWGPVPFIIMAPESFTPNYPDGRFYDHLQRGTFAIGDYVFATGNFGIEKGYPIGIIGKDRVYVPPNSKGLTLIKGEKNSYTVSSSGIGDKKLIWDNKANSYYDKETECWAWFNESYDAMGWQYYYDSISSDYPDFGWMKHNSEGWYIEESNKNWIKLPDSYDTSRLWYID